MSDRGVDGEVLSVVEVEVCSIINGGSARLAREEKREKRTKEESDDSPDFPLPLASLPLPLALFAILALILVPTSLGGLALYPFPWA